MGIWVRGLRKAHQVRCKSHKNGNYLHRYTPTYIGRDAVVIQQAFAETRGSTYLMLFLTPRPPIFHGGFSFSRATTCVRLHFIVVARPQASNTTI